MYFINAIFKEINYSSNDIEFLVNKKMKQKFKFSSLLLLLIIQTTLAQNYQTVEEVNDACASLGFTSNEEAEIAVDRILDEFGLFRNFIIQECPDINNAVAKVIEVSEGYKERYILYDNNFFDGMNNKAQTDWASMSILAHEIGHHLNGHSLNNEGSNHQFELEADYFSGSALAKLGASLEESQSAIMTLKYEKATRTHPAKADRLKAIEEGWYKSAKIKKVEVINEDNIELYTYNKELVVSYTKLAIEVSGKSDYSSAAKNMLMAFQYSSGKNFELLYNTIIYYINAEDYSSALKYSLALTRTGINSLEQDERSLVYKNIGLIYINQNRFDEALKFFDFALQSDPNDVDILLARANLYYKTEEKETFESELKKVNRLRPNNADVLFNLGVISAERGKIEEANNYYDRALTINPNYINALLNKAVLVLNEETPIIEEMNSLGTSESENRRYDALKLEREQIYRDALIYLERILKLEPNNTEVLKTVANIYKVLGK